MASSIGRLLKATIEVSTKGTGAAKDALRSVGAEIDALSGKQVSTAGYAAQAKGLKQLAQTAQGAQAAFALTRQEALTLNYTIGDVVASLSSGASPMTILLQQGGQVRDGFGNLSNLLSKISAQFLRFAPQIAVIGAAIGAISFVKIGESAAAAADEVAKLAARAGLATGAFQDLQAAASVKDVSGAALSQSLNSLSGAALKSADSWKEFQTRLSAGRDAWTGVIKDSKLAAEYTERLGGSARVTGDAFTDLGLNIKNYTGSTQDAERLTLDVARAISTLDPGSRKAQMALRELEGIVGQEGMKVFSLGVEGIKKYSAAVDGIAPKLTDEQIALGKKYEESVRLYEAGNKRLKESLGAIFIPAAIAQQDFFGGLLKNTGAKAKALRSDLEIASKAIVEFFAVLSGKQANFTSPFLAGIVDGIRLVHKSLDELSKSIGPIFETIKAYATDGLNAIDTALSKAGGNISTVFARVKDAATKGFASLKSVFSGLNIDARSVGALTGILAAIKAIQVAAGLAAPIVTGLATTILKLAVGTAVAPITAVAGAISSIGTAVLQSGAAVVRFAAGFLSLAAGAASAAVLSPIAAIVQAIGSAAAAATNGVLALGKALAGLAVRTIFSPAVVGVAAIAAAVAAVGLLVVNWDRVKAAVSLAGAAIQADFLIPLQVFGLKALAIVQAVFGVFESIGQIAGSVLAPLADVGKVLASSIGGFLGKVLDAGVSQLRAFASVAAKILNAVWSGAGDVFEKSLKGILSTQDSYFKQFSKNFETAGKTWDKALSLSGAQAEADKALEDARKRFQEVSRLDGTFAQDQAKRLAQTYNDALSTIGSATGGRIDPNNLGASAINEVNRLLGLTKSGATDATAAVADLVQTGQEAAGQTANIRIFKNGEAQQVKVVKDGVVDLTRAINEIPKDAEIRIIRPGSIETVTKQVEAADTAVQNATISVDKLSTKLDVTTNKVVTPQVDTVQIDALKTKLDETQAKKDALAAPLPPAQTAPAVDQAGPLAQATAAIDALKQKISDALAEAQTYSVSAVSAVSEGISISTTAATTAIDSLIQALDRAIQSVGNLAASINALPPVPSTGGAAQGGSTGPGFASGGYVAGAGTGTSDSIAAWLSNGEFVVRSAAVRIPGVLDLLHRINGMRFSTAGLTGRNRFANGGLVGVPNLAGAGGSGRSFNLVIDGRSFSGLTGNSDTISQLEKYATLRQLSATSKRAPSRIG